MKHIRVTFGIEKLFLGCADGVDKAARNFAKFYEIEAVVKYADWSLGYKAGPLRNREMVKAAVAENADGAVAFPDGGPGTRNCVGQCLEFGLPVAVFDMYGRMLPGQDWLKL